MRIDHLYGRSVADTAAMAALTHRHPAAVRTICKREPEGYDVDVCIAELNANPTDPTLYTAAQAQRELGIPAGTVRQWASYGRIRARHRDGRGSPLYDAEELRALKREPRGNLTR